MTAGGAIRYTVFMSEPHELFESLLVENILNETEKSLGETGIQTNHARIRGAAFIRSIFEPVSEGVEVRDLEETGDTPSSRLFSDAAEDS